jgi:hypothetical protein
MSQHESAYSQHQRSVMDTQHAAHVPAAAGAAVPL